MTKTNHTFTGQAPVIPLLQARRMERRRHRDLVAKAKAATQDFIKILSQCQPQDRTYTLSMDLFSFFERFCRFDLPDRFQIEFGRQITKACRDGRLPFRRTTHTRASLAAFDGISLDLLQAALQTARTPAA